MVQEKNLAIGAILIMAATPLISHKNVWDGFWPPGFATLYHWEGGGWRP